MAQKSTNLTKPIKSFEHFSIAYLMKFYATWLNLIGVFWKWNKKIWNKHIFGLCFSSILFSSSFLLLSLRPLSLFLCLLNRHSIICINSRKTDECISMKIVQHELLRNKTKQIQNECNVNHKTLRYSILRTPLNIILTIVCWPRSSCILQLSSCES